MIDLLTSHWRLGLCAYILVDAVGKLGNDASLSREFRVYSRDGGYAYGISSEVKRNEGLNEGLTSIGIDKKQTMVEGSESRK